MASIHDEHENEYDLRHPANSPEMRALIDELTARATSPYTIQEYDQKLYQRAADALSASQPQGDVARLEREAMRLAALADGGAVAYIYRSQYDNTVQIAPADDFIAHGFAERHPEARALVYAVPPTQDRG